jgi:hypothetical protein
MFAESESHRPSVVHAPGFRVRPGGHLAARLSTSGAALVESSSAAETKARSRYPCQAAATRPAACRAEPLSLPPGHDSTRQQAFAVGSMRPALGRSIAAGYCSSEALVVLGPAAKARPSSSATGSATASIERLEVDGGPPVYLASEVESLVARATAGPLTRDHRSTEHPSRPQRSERWPLSFHGPNPRAGCRWALILRRRSLRRPP